MSCFFVVRLTVTELFRKAISTAPSETQADASSPAQARRERKNLDIPPHAPYLISVSTLPFRVLMSFCSAKLIWAACY